MELISHHDNSYLIKHLIRDYENFKTRLGAFGQYTIAVPNKSIENWLKKELVNHIEICSGIQFVSLYGLLHTIQKQSSPEHQQLITKEQLNKYIYKTLTEIKHQDITNNDELIVLKKWLQAQNLAESLAKLSNELADVFELYQIYRTDWLDKWKNNELVLEKENDSWQAALWRKITDVLPEDAILHRQQLTQQFEDLFSQIGESIPIKKYQQIMVYGVNHIDLETIRQLKLIHQQVQVPITFLWRSSNKKPLGDNADIVEIIRNQKPFFSGNPLLASWAGAAREQALTFKNLNYETDNNMDYSNPNSDCLLGKIQKEIITNNPVSAITNKTNISLDTSLTFVSHYSRFREVEGLHDYLLDQMHNEDIKLVPNDMLILCPDINAYAPYFRSVFENQNSKKKIPYQICGMSSHSDDVASLMLQLIEMPTTRYEFSDVLDVLNHRYIRLQFQLTAEDVTQIHDWLKQANVYWGLDVKTLSQLELPEYDRYTFSSGIDRLVMGFSLDGENVKINDKIYYGVEGISSLDSALLSKFIVFFEQIKQWRDYSLTKLGHSETRTINSWIEELRDLTDKMISVPRKESESLNSWNKILASTEKIHQESVENDNSTYSFAYIVSVLKNKVDEVASSSGSYQYGKVNIGSFGSLKGIPAKVIALLGLNESDFPRKQKPDGINLTLSHSKLGDRNHTTQDKDAFLMSLLSCQNAFYCSYVGKDIRTNSDRIPSLLLQELIDYINPDEKIQKELIQQHPMKSYSDKYFEGNEELNTYQDFNTSDKLLPGLKQDTAQSLPEWNFKEQITIKQLTDFLEDPAKAFFKERFNVHFPELEEESNDTEPFESSGLVKWQIINELLELGMQENEDSIPNELMETVGDKYMAQGLMEHDSNAKQIISDCMDIANEIFIHATNAKQSLDPNTQQVSLNLVVDNQEVKLVGDLSVYSDEYTANIIQVVHKKVAKTNSKYLMKTIVNTRIAEALKVENALNYQSSYLVGLDGICKLSADSESGQISLQKWLGLYKQVMNTPIAMDLNIAEKIFSNKSDMDYKSKFEEVNADSESAYNFTKISEALKQFTENPQAITHGKALVENYTYIKPKSKLDEDSLKPRWDDVTEELKS